MSRHDNADVSHIQVPDDQDVVVHHEWDGILCAKEVEVPDFHISRWIKCSSVMLLDPRRLSEFTYKRKTWKMTRVTEACLDQYILFLKTSKTLHLTHAQRNL